jgi:hypothetical protein
VALVAVPLVLEATRPPAVTGTRPAAAAAVQASAEPETLTAAAPPVVETATVEPAVPEVPRTAGALTGAAGRPMAAPVPAVPPVAVRADAVEIAAPVVPVGVEPGSAAAMEVPDDPFVAGWYAFGPAPGDPGGVAVLTSHVDMAATGPGAFHRLRDLQPGDPVTLELADGRVLTYAVTGREQMAKGAFPAAEVFRRDGPPALALVTCGGEFDRASGHYLDNVVVWAIEQR